MSSCPDGFRARLASSDARFALCGNPCALQVSRHAGLAFHAINFDLSLRNFLAGLSVSFGFRFQQDPGLGRDQGWLCTITLTALQDSEGHPRHLVGHRVSQLGLPVLREQL